MTALLTFSDPDNLKEDHGRPTILMLLFVLAAGILPMSPLWHECPRCIFTQGERL